MTILHGDDRFYNNIFIQNWPVKEVEVKEDMGFRMADNQQVGTSVFEEYPTYEEWISNFDFTKPANMMTLASVHFGHLPVWINGNAYFNGALPSSKEKDNLVDTENKVSVSLEEKDGRIYLKTNILDFLKDFEDGIITSDILGKAFEPEQRFENPDGTAITFDSDYYGGHRGLSTIPGPFASKEALDKPVW